MTRLKQWRCVLRGSAIRACRQLRLSAFIGCCLFGHFGSAQINLIAVCKAYKADYITDPSNTDRPSRGHGSALGCNSQTKGAYSSNWFTCPVFGQLSERLAALLPNGVLNISFLLCVYARRLTFHFFRIEWSQTEFNPTSLFVGNRRPAYSLSDDRLDRGAMARQWTQ